MTTAVVFVDGSGAEHVVIIDDPFVSEPVQRALDLMRQWKQSGGAVYVEPLTLKDQGR